MKIERILIVPDTHRPYHDKKAWALMLKVAADFKPNTIVVQGDFGDFYCTNGHRKDPNRNRFLEGEINDVNVGLDELDALKPQRKIFIQGNHEENLERYLIDKAPELFNMVTTEELLNLRKRKWEYYAYRKEKAWIGKLAIAHDLGSSGAAAVPKALAEFQGNITIGHIHRMCYMIGGNYQGETHVAASFGWLGDITHVDYMDRDKAAKDWALGFGLGYKLPNGVVHLTPIPIVNYGTVVEGIYYKGTK